jgi:hypothetical protein
MRANMSAFPRLVTGEEWRPLPTSTEEILQPRRLPAVQTNIAEIWHD